MCQTLNKLNIVLKLHLLLKNKNFNAPELEGQRLFIFKV